MSDLFLCRTMGWTYAELLDLPVEVYTVLVEELSKEAAKK